MPLNQSVAREFITRRTITCEGYCREDGLLDVEGRLVDVRGFDVPSDWRKDVLAGQPVHDMSARITIDENLLIHAVEAQSDASPFRICSEVIPNMQRLVGLTIGHGFKKTMNQLIGGSEGCTHIRTLLEALSGVAVHTISGKSRNDPGGMAAFWATFGERGERPPTLIDSCHAYAADGANVQRLFPLHHKPRS